MDSNPEQSFAYAQQGTALGDNISASLQSHLLDYSGKPLSRSMGTDRVQTISRLLAKLDPVFSFHVLKSEEIKNLGFIQFISGNL